LKNKFITLSDLTDQQKNLKWKGWKLRTQEYVKSKTFQPYEDFTQTAPYSYPIVFIGFENAEFSGLKKLPPLSLAYFLFIYKKEVTASR